MTPAELHLVNDERDTLPPCPPPPGCAALEQVIVDLGVLRNDAEKALAKLNDQRIAIHDIRAAVADVRETQAVILDSIRTLTDAVLGALAPRGV